MKIVGKMANNVDNNGGQAVREKRPQDTSSKQEPYYNEFCTYIEHFSVSDF
jgi:hypothetical protein